MDASKITTGKRKTAGGIYCAPANTTLPTDAATALASAFKELGYVAEDGVVNSISRETTDVKEWGGDVVDTIITGQTDAFKFKLMESVNVDTLKAVFGASNVTESSGAITVTVKSDNPTSYVWVIDMAIKNNRMKRIVIPDGKITALGDISYKSTEMTMYDVTLSCAYDSTIGGTHKEYVSATPT